MVAEHLASAPTSGKSIWVIVIKTMQSGCSQTRFAEPQRLPLTHPDGSFSAQIER
jgi:hypothetical protein